MPLIPPSLMIMAQLYNFPLNGTGAPTTIAGSLSCENSASHEISSSHLRRRVFWLNRSPQLYPDTESSGKTTRDTSLTTASQTASFMSVRTLYDGLATLVCMEAAIVRMNPKSFIIMNIKKDSLSAVLQVIELLKFFEIYVGEVPAGLFAFKAFCLDVVNYLLKSFRELFEILLIKENLVLVV